MIETHSTHGQDHKMTVLGITTKYFTQWQDVSAKNGGIKSLQGDAVIVMVIFAGKNIVKVFSIRI